MADWAVHSRPHCVAAVEAGIFKQGTILLHHPVKFSALSFYLIYLRIVRVHHTLGSYVYKIFHHDTETNNPHLICKEMPGKIFRLISPSILAHNYLYILQTLIINFH